MFKIVPAAVYDSLGAEGIKFAFNKCHLTTFFTSSKHVDEFMKDIKDFPSLKNLITFEPITEE